MIPDAKIPSGPLESKWSCYRRESSLVSPNNKRKLKIAVVGTGLAGASAAATLSELGYQVEVFTFHDSPRRAHSVAAQGGINAAKNYRGDGDSIYRLFYDTIKGGDFRSREANVYRLAEVSTQIIDQCVSQGVPFAREYGGQLANRSFGGALVSRTFYCRGQTGQQLLLGAYSALNKQIASGAIRMHTKKEMLDLVVCRDRARGIVTRDLRTGEVEAHLADAVVVATGGYSNVFFLSTNASGSNATAIWRCHRRGAAFANPCFTQIHPTCIPPSGEFQAKLTLMSESLRNDGRIWVPSTAGDQRPSNEIPEGERDYYLERKYPSYGNLAPRDISSRSAKEVCDEGRGVGPTGVGVNLDFRDAMQNKGIKYVQEKYGNLFHMYEQITGENPYQTPMRIYPAPHYSMGGLWVNYELMSTIPGLFVIGEANFSDHGANRLGASALMQGLADGYFVLPNTIGNYFANQDLASVNAEDDDVTDAMSSTSSQSSRLLSIGGKTAVEQIHRDVGRIVWEECGMSRNREGLQKAIKQLGEQQERFWNEAAVTGKAEELNSNLEKAGRVADFIELAQLMCRDALEREESCGAHFREEYQTSEGEALRNDEKFCNVFAWNHRGNHHELDVETLEFEEIGLETRSYK